MRIDESDAEFEFSKVASRIAHLTENENIVLHNSCHLSFKSHISRKEVKYEKHKVSAEVQSTQDDEPGTSSIEVEHIRRSRRKSGGDVKMICFVCNEIKDIDNESYNAGGLARCERDSASETLDNTFKDFKEGHKFYDAAQRLVVVKARSHDLFAADLFYHKQCYNQYVSEHHRIVHFRPEIGTEKEKEIERQVNEEFFKLLEKKVVVDKNAYLLTELITDIA